MDKNGLTITQAADIYLNSKRERGDRLTRATFLVFGMTEVVLQARLAQKAYMVGREAALWKTMEGRLAEFDTQAEKLAQITGEEDAESLNRMRAAVADYRKAAQAWLARSIDFW